MASLTLKNVMKIYPHNGDDAKKAKKKKKNADEPEKKKVNLQITEKGVVAVQQFNLDIRTRNLSFWSVLPAAVSPPLCV